MTLTRRSALTIVALLATDGRVLTARPAGPVAFIPSQTPPKLTFRVNLQAIADFEITGPDGRIAKITSEELWQALQP